MKSGLVQPPRRKSGPISVQKCGQLSELGSVGDVLTWIPIYFGISCPPNMITLEKHLIRLCLKQKKVLRIEVILHPTMVMRSHLRSLYVLRGAILPLPVDEIGTE